ncbi:ATP synthase F1 subunit delta [Candidatus Uhrbacteria bacterium]|nr:ATP synthase F1 subunit delta [Candidatus Uhrbacteria bacterium]MBD3284534.1 ATP synthase F1 subunit delta [Candidatus Uhrbacteria bacterium]
MANKTPLQAYATAFVDTLPEGVDAIGEITELLETINNVPELSPYLEDPSITVEDKQKALTIALPNVQPETRNLLLLLANEERTHELKSLSNRVQEASAAKEDRMFAKVTSAIPLTNEEVTQLASALQKRLNQPILIDATVDKTLLGGLQVRIGDWTFDASLQGRLHRLKQSLTI